jgi:hypothetical protein
MLLLSCWRWGVENGNLVPDFCSTCGCSINSFHLLFRCPCTQQVRDKFRQLTGRDFDLDTFADQNCSQAVTGACEQICQWITQGGAPAHILP